MSIDPMTKDLALSPSVNIKVHSSEFFLPASLASSNFSIPNSRADFAPLSYLFIFISNLAFACETIASIISVLRRSFINFSETENLSVLGPPNSEILNLL